MCTGTVLLRTQAIEVNNLGSMSALSSTFIIDRWVMVKFFDIFTRTQAMNSPLRKQTNCKNLCVGRRVF